MKLSLDALKERAGATASTDLLATISGGTDNACHDAPAPAAPSAPSTSWEIGGGVSVPVGGQPTFKLEIKFKF